MPQSSSAFATGFLAVLLCACADPTPSQAPSAQQSPASSRDTQRIERFQQQAELDRNALKIPGLSAVILEDGKVLWAQGFGYADVEGRIPATPDTLFHIASLTKTFTAILVLQLVEQGKLDLDEPMSRYSDDFKDDSVKLKHLLSHTSDGTPGERFQYNPDRFEYLKIVLEKKTGKPLRALFAETFLDPLAMRDSVPGPDVADDATKWAVLGEKNLERYRSNLAKFAQPYTLYGADEILHVPYPPKDFWASAGLLSTVQDMAKYDTAVDAHRFLSKETQDKAWTPFTSNDGKPLAHGLGWFVTDYRGTRLVWHYGHWGTGFSAIYLKVPARRLSLVMLANSEALADHQFKVGEDITNNLFACNFLRVFVPEVATGPRTEDAEGTQGTQVSPGDAASSSEPAKGPATDCESSSRTALAKWIEDRRSKAHKVIQVDPKRLEAYVGRYQFEHRVVTVSQEGSRLFIDSPKDSKSELFAESPSRFFLKILPWQFTFVQEGSRVTHLELVADGQTLRAKKIE